MRYQLEYCFTLESFALIVVPNKIFDCIDEAMLFVSKDASIALRNNAIEFENGEYKERIPAEQTHKYQFKYLGHAMNWMIEQFGILWVNNFAEKPCKFEFMVYSVKQISGKKATRPITVGTLDANKHHTHV